MLAVSAFVLALLSLAGIGLQGAQASGLGLDAASRPSLIGDVLDTRFGEAWLLRAVLAASIAIVAGLAAWRLSRRAIALSPGWRVLLVLPSPQRRPSQDTHEPTDE